MKRVHFIVRVPDDDGVVNEFIDAVEELINSQTGPDETVDNDGPWSWTWTVV